MSDRRRSRVKTFAGVAVSVDIDHSYRGDLNVSVLVYSDDLEPLCEVELPTPERSDSEADYRGTFPVDDCAEYAPPAPDQRWSSEGPRTIRA